MKKLILSEGRNDTYFLSQIIELHDSDFKINILDIEEYSIDEQKPLQSEKIRDFIPKYNPYAVFLKSEGGQNSLKKVYCSLASHLASMELDNCLFIDLDGGSIDTYVGDLNGRLEDIHPGNDVHLSQDSEIISTESVVIQIFNVMVNSSAEDKIPIIALKNTLEDEANIDRGESREVKSEKLDAIASQSEYSEPIIDAIFNSIYYSSSSSSS